jgi:hypothetical protein
LSLSLFNSNNFSFSIFKLRKNNKYRGNYFSIETNKKNDIIIYDIGDDKIDVEVMENEILKMEIAH